MHPLLASGRRFMLYLLGWTPIVALLAYMVWASGRVSWTDAAAALLPACLVYSFTCLSPWYICRTRPLTVANIPGLVLTYGAAGAASGLIFVASTMLAALALGHTAALTGIDQRFHASLVPLFAVGVLLYLLSAGLHYAALAAEASRDAERRAAESLALAREAELAALRMQLNPHFLFNSLHSIAALATGDGLRAREMCTRLAGFLRSSLGLGARESVPLREELALANSYLEVEQVRFGNRLRVEHHVEPGCEDCEVPPLLLQPLVENAVKHGIAGLIEGGAIRLAAKRSGESVAITIENEFDPDMPPARKSGLGLALVRRRLEVRYGAKASLEVGPSEEIYRVVLRLPCESPITSSSRA